MRNPITRHNSRSASAALEVILAGPVVVITIFAAFQYGVAVLCRQAVAQASGAGARVASAEGSDFTDVVAEVEAVLQAHDVPVSNVPGSGVKVLLEEGGVPLQEFGDPTLTCNPPANPTMAGDEVRVTVCLELTTGPLLNVLQSFGFDFSGRRFEIATLLAKE